MLGADINCAIERAAGVMCTVLTQLETSFIECRVWEGQNPLLGADINCAIERAAGVMCTVCQDNSLSQHLAAVPVSVD